ISSVMGLIPAPFMALYSASKHAVEGYSESLDHEIRGSGVRVVLIEPAYTRTSFDGNVYRADQQLEIYHAARANAEGVLRDEMKTADAPELVASAVVKASTETHPRRRYATGRTARQVSLLRRFVPESAFDRSLRKQMRLPAVDGWASPRRPRPPGPLLQRPGHPLEYRWQGDREPLVTLGNQ